MTEETVRLAKLMAQMGLCSRREAETLIVDGLVRVNGEVHTDLGAKVPTNARVELEGAAVKALDDQVTIVVHKPVGFVSGQAEPEHRPAVELIREEHRWAQERGRTRIVRNDLAPAGRLDIDSKGLLILTADGVVARAIIGENSQVDKEYIVKVDGVVTDKKLELMRYGMSLDGRKLKEARVELVRPTLLRFILREGRKRQIRRMCEMVELEVLSLKRIRIGPIELGTLPEGKWRFLTGDERARLLAVPTRKVMVRSR